MYLTIYDNIGNGFVLCQHWDINTFYMFNPYVKRKIYDRLIIYSIKDTQAFDSPNTTNGNKFCFD